MKKNIRASFIESGFDAFHNIVEKNIFYYIAHMNEKFDFSIFESALLCVFNNIPKLRSTMKLGFINDYWEVKDNFNKVDLPIISELVNANSKEEFREEVIRKFEENDKNNIDIHRELPLKIYRYYSKELNVTSLIFATHHAFCDGRGTAQIINYIGQCYFSILDERKSVFKNNFSDLSQIVINYNKKTLRKKYKKLKKEKNNKIKNIEPFLDKVWNNLEPKNINKIASLEIIVLKKGNYQILKKFCRENKLSINSVIMFFILVMTQKYNKLTNENNHKIGCSCAIDGRRHLSVTDIDTIANFSGFDIFVIDSDIIENKDYNKFKEEMEKFKHGLLGMEFFSIMKMMDKTPRKIIRILISLAMSKFCDEESTKGFSISNCGNLSEMLGRFNEICSSIYFIPTINRTGLPQFGVSSFDENLTITIAKENDNKMVTKELRKVFVQIINEILLKYEGYEVIE